MILLQMAIKCFFSFFPVLSWLGWEICISSGAKHAGTCVLLWAGQDLEEVQSSSALSHFCLKLGVKLSAVAAASSISAENLGVFLH